MKRLSLTFIILVAAIQLTCCQSKPENWTSDQLEQPADLAQRINENKTVPVIINVGPGAIIPHSIDAGAAGEAEGAAKLKSILSKLNKDADIVVYCGCCPFAHCPNVRPAIQVLKENKFTNYHLLNIPQNIRVDWIARGYPVNKK